MYPIFLLVLKFLKHTGASLCSFICKFGHGMVLLISIATFRKSPMTMTSKTMTATVMMNIILKKMITMMIMTRMIMMMLMMMMMMMVMMEGKEEDEDDEEDEEDEEDDDIANEYCWRRAACRPTLALTS